MSTTLFAGISGALDAWTRRWTQTPAWAKIASFLAVPAFSYVFASYAVNYRRWTAMGPGGLPHNHAGYLVNVLVTALFARNETRDVTLYDKPASFAPGWNEASDKERAMAQKSFLSEPLPRRKGTQAHALSFVAPQREHFASEYQVPKVKEAYLAAFQQLRAGDQDGVEWKTSVLERQGLAAFVKPGVAIPRLAGKTQREICHLHASDLSGHVTLSLADAKEVIAKGWGERHRLSGTKLLDLGYTFTYVPRTVDEVELFVRIMQAGIDYMRSSGI